MKVKIELKPTISIGEEQIVKLTIIPAKHEASVYGIEATAIFYRDNVEVHRETKMITFKEGESKTVEFKYKPDVKNSYTVKIQLKGAIEDYEKMATFMVDTSYERAFIVKEAIITEKIIYPVIAGVLIALLTQKR